MRAVPPGHTGLYSGLVLRHCEEIEFGDRERTEPGSAVIITPEDGASRSLPGCLGTWRSYACICRKMVAGAKSYPLFHFGSVRTLGRPEAVGSK